MLKPLFAAATLFLACPALAGETLDRVMAAKSMTEVTDQAYPPFSFIDDKGEIVGFDIDVAREFARRLGVEMKVETPSWEITTAGNWQGRYDICVCSMTPTTERAGVLDFVTQYYAAPAVAVVNAANTSIKSPADLNGRRVGAQAGTSYEKYVNRELTIQIPGVADVKVEFPFAEASAVPYDSEDTAFQDLALGDGTRLDAVVSNYITARDRVDKSGGKFRVVEGDLFAEPIWISADKGDAEWNAKIKEVFKAMSDDGTLAKISGKWIGRDITTKQ